MSIYEYVTYFGLANIFSHSRTIWNVKMITEIRQPVFLCKKRARLTSVSI